MNNTLAARQIVEILKQARSKIDSPEKWIQGQDHRRNDDGVIECRCARWAIVESTGEVLKAEPMVAWTKSYAVISAFMRSLRKRGHASGGIALYTWNDQPRRTHAEIMQGFAWAIEDAGKVSR